MPRKPPYRPTRGPRRRGPRVTYEVRDQANAPKVRYFRPRRRSIGGSVNDPDIAPVWVTQPTPPDAVQGESYFYSLASLLNTTFQVELTVTAGALPPGITISGLTLIGTPTSAGTFSNIQLTATNNNGSDESDPFQIVITALSWISTPTPPNAAQGVAYNYDMAPHLNSTENITLSTFAGQLPAGLGYSGTRITGTPTTIENQTGIQTNASNGVGSDNSPIYSLQVDEGIVVWTSQPNPPDGVVGVSYDYDLTPFLNTTAGVVVTVTSGSLPPGLSIVGLSIQGTPTTVGSYTNIRLTATNSFNSDQTDPFGIDIGEAVTVGVRLDNPTQNVKEVFDQGREVFSSGGGAQWTSNSAPDPDTGDAVIGQVIFWSRDSVEQAPIEIAAGVDSYDFGVSGAISWTVANKFSRGVGASFPRQSL